MSASLLTGQAGAATVVSAAKEAGVHRQAMWAFSKRRGLGLQAVPLYIGAAWEARMRREFLQRSGRPLGLLGLFWSSCLRWTGAPQL